MLLPIEQISFHDGHIEWIQLDALYAEVAFQAWNMQQYSLLFQDCYYMHSLNCANVTIDRLSIIDAYEEIMPFVADLPEDMFSTDRPPKLYRFYDTWNDKAVLTIVAAKVEVRCKTEETYCYTYFGICSNGELGPFGLVSTDAGAFDPDHITKLLGIKPFRSFKKGDWRKNISTDAPQAKFGFSRWCACESRADRYDVNKQCLETIQDLKEKIPELLKIKDLYDVDFTLMVVAYIYRAETPILSFDKEIIEFCHLTGTEIDVDTYVYE